MTRDEIAKLEGDALRRAVAEALGWTCIWREEDGRWFGKVEGTLDEVPDYPADPAGTWEMEETLSGEKHERYGAILSAETAHKSPARSPGDLYYASPTPHPPTAAARSCSRSKRRADRLPRHPPRRK